MAIQVPNESGTKVNLRGTRAGLEGSACNTQGKMKSIVDQVDIDVQIEPSKQVEKPTQRNRFYICTLGVASLACSFSTRLIFNILIHDINRVSCDKSASLRADEDVTTENPSETTRCTKRWSEGELQILMLSFYLCYCPMMSISGYITDRFGSKPLMMLNVAGSGAVSMLTPIISQHSYFGTVLLRMFMGLCQASMMPALYGLFNCWLTKTEANMFTTTIRISIGVGFLLGFQFPNIIERLGFDWPATFYLAGGIALIWSVAWFSVGYSTPEQSSCIHPDELRWIQRKKLKAKKEVSDAESIEIELVQMKGDVGVELRAAPEVEADRKSSTNLQKDCSEFPTNQIKESMTQEGDEVEAKEEEAANGRTILLLILTHPSFLVLAFTKFCYNLGAEFINIELASFATNIHRFKKDEVGLIPVFGTLLTILLVPWVSWLAKYFVQRNQFGLSRTSWRKVFQGSANFACGGCYLALGYIQFKGLTQIALMVTLIYLTWMLGAGGESMAAYDMSTKYPSTIYGLAHSCATTTGLFIPTLGSLVLDSEGSDPACWSLMFLICGWLQVFGGIIFVSFFKAEPFLPCEIVSTSGEQQKPEVGREPISNVNHSDTC